MMFSTCKAPTMRALFWWLILPLAIVLYTAAWLTPARVWYEPGSIQIADAYEGEDPVVSINRTIRRSFDGRYTVSLWRDPPDGHVACAGSDTLRYRGGLYEPHEAPLTQWADDEWCARLPEGKYYAEVCWTVLRPFFGIVPDKTVCATTNIFSVKPREG